jgi:hypothetical protein
VEELKVIFELQEMLVGLLELLERSMKTEIFGLQMMFLYLLKKYGMIIEGLVVVLKAIDQLETM